MYCLSYSCYFSFLFFIIKFSLSSSQNILVLHISKCVEIVQSGRDLPFSLYYHSILVARGFFLLFFSGGKKTRAQYLCFNSLIKFLVFVKMHLQFSRKIRFSDGNYNVTQTIYSKDENEKKKKKNYIRRISGHKKHIQNVDFKQKY